MDTRYNRLNEVVLTSTQNLCFEQKYEKYQNFYQKTSSYLFFFVGGGGGGGGGFSIYLNRRVFVIGRAGP